MRRLTARCGGGVVLGASRRSVGSASTNHGGNVVFRRVAGVTAFSRSLAAHVLRKAGMPAVILFMYGASVVDVGLPPEALQEGIFRVNAPAVTLSTRSGSRCRAGCQ